MLLLLLLLLVVVVVVPVLLILLLVVLLALLLLLLFLLSVSTFEHSPNCVLVVLLQTVEREGEEGGAVFLETKGKVSC